MESEGKQYTVDEVKHLHGDVLTSVAMDKRQNDPVREAAMRKSNDTAVWAEIMNDLDNSQDLRDVARGMLEERNLVTAAMSADEEQEI